MFPWSAADMDVVVTNDQMTVGGCDVNMADVKLCPSSAVTTGRREVLPSTRNAASPDPSLFYTRLRGSESRPRRYQLRGMVLTAGYESGFP